MSKKRIKKRGIQGMPLDEGAGLNLENVQRLSDLDKPKVTKVEVEEEKVVSNKNNAPDLEIVENSVDNERAAIKDKDVGSDKDRKSAIKNHRASTKKAKPQIKLDDEIGKRGRPRIHNGPTRTYSVEVNKREKDDAELLINKILLSSDKHVTVSDVVSERLTDFVNESRVYSPDFKFPRKVRPAEFRITLPIETCIEFKEYKKWLKDNDVTHINSIVTLSRYVLIKWIDENKSEVMALRRREEGRAKRKIVFE